MDYVSRPERCLPYARVMGEELESEGSMNDPISDNDSSSVGDFEGFDDSSEVNIGDEDVNSIRMLMDLVMTMNHLS